MHRVSMLDTSLRDGQKSLGINLSVNEKLEISRQLVRLGVDVIEAGYPAASPLELEAVRKIAREIKGVIICGFARVNEREIDCCAAALKEAGQSRIHTGIAVSPFYMEKKLRLTPGQVVDLAVAAVKHAKKYVGDVQFYAEDAFRSDRAFLVQVLEKVIEAGATVVNIPDTLGYATPWECGEMISYIRNNVRNIHRAVISVHCHNDLGMATANSLAGIKAGADQVEGTINGIGERAGNTCLEEIIMALYSHRSSIGIQCGAKPQELTATSRLVSRLTGVPVPAHKAIVGSNAYSGAPASLEEIGPGENAPLEIVAQDDHDLSALETGIEQRGILIKNISITTTGASRATATVTLDLDGNTVTEAACGAGPVDAVFKAVDLLVGEQVYLEDFMLKSVGRGRETLGDATVKVRYGDKGLVVGRGVSSDVIEASARAYANALSKVKTMIRENAAQGRV
ncbi:MAG TPA: 2-isopropylmalate synthase [Bacillota bacterium]|nr:2-isopropylmalate synthase [Bacillota bacterium]HPZ44401.1 2-isopropylmalate synthase [Bacillota bacterium]HQD77180.1 2-isopropylmalate synthase [Bacillota bacterium]HUM59742.1 2-isopropylmalate synthase [Bacillota bacterium]